jgi:hypothetical protein
LIPTTAKVGVSQPPQGQPTNLRPRIETLDCDHFMCPIKHQSKLRNGEDVQADSNEIEVRRRKLVGQKTLKNLVVLMRFKGHQNRPLRSRQEYDILFNGSKDDCAKNFNICGLSGSVKTYFQTFTHGQLTIESTVVDWVDVPYTEAWAANGNSG